jgi:flavin-binding protein dodecin
MIFRIVSRSGFQNSATLNSNGGITMSVAKVIEISAESSKSFEDAIQEGIKRAGKTVDRIKTAWVKDQQVTVKDNKVVAYRVSLKVTFVIGD